MIPEFFRMQKRWAVYGPDKKPWLASPLQGQSHKQDGAPNQLLYPAANNKDDGLVTYDYALASVAKGVMTQGWPEGKCGPAYAMRAEDCIVCIDLDDPVKAIASSNYAHISQENKDIAVELVLALNRDIYARFSAAGAYIEHSMSGNGAHIFFKAKLPEGVTRCTMNICGSIFSADQFIYMRQDGNGDLIDGQLLLNEVLMEYGAAGKYNPAHGQMIHEVVKADYAGIESGMYAAYGRQLGMPDTDVINQLQYKNKASWAALVTGEYSKDHSDTVKNLIGDLDKVTGDPDQIKRLVMGSRVLMLHPVGANGQLRADKWDRHFEAELVKRRAANDLELSKRELEREAAKAVLAGKEIVVESQTPVASSIPKHFEIFQRLAGDLPREYWDICLPPGMAGQFVRETLEASPIKDIVYAVPSVLTQLSPYVARWVDGPYGQPACFMVIVSGHSATGKTTSVDAFGKLEAQSFKGQVSLKSRSKKIKIGSKQGAHAVFEEFPAVNLVDDDCETIMSLTFTGANKAGEINIHKSAITAMVLAIYDAPTSPIDSYQPDASVRSKASGEKEIRRLRVSQYWSTTPGVFSTYITEEGVLKGLGSRVLMVVHPEKYELPDEDFNLRRTFSDGPRIRLMQLAEKARAFDVIMQNPGWDGAGVENIGMSVDAGLWLRGYMRRLRELNFEVANAGGGTDTLLARTDMLALRIATVVCVADGRTEVSLQDLWWSIGYVLQNSCIVAGMFHKQELGASVEKADDTVLRIMRRMLDRHDRGIAGKLAGGVNSGVLRKACLDVRPFRGMSGVQGRQLLDTVLREMVASGQLVLNTQYPEAGKGGKPADVYSLA